jgi:FMN phosphatase YigB (HAD superfamily)
MLEQHVSCILQNLELYPGVKDTLDELKKQGLKLAVIADADSYHTLARQKNRASGFF